MKTMTETQPRQAIIYTRLSDARSPRKSDNGKLKEASLKDQESQCRELAGRLGLEIIKVVVENELSGAHASAFKKRRVTVDGKPAWRVRRKGWSAVVDELTSGAANALLVLDMDRATRNMRDLLDVIDLVEHGNIDFKATTGSFDLTTPGGQMVAQVLASHAEMSSKDTSRRVKDARRRQAEAGTYGGGGRRPYGYQSDGMTVIDAEADIVREVTAGVAGGRSLRSMAADLRARGVPTATGTGRWTPETGRNIILRPRNAGRTVYQGDEVGDGRWPAIVDERTWRSAVAILTSPARRTQRGNAVKWLGSCIYRCGKCGGTLTSQRKQDRQSYCCRECGSVKVGQAALDALIREVVITRLSQPDAAELIADNSRAAELAAAVHDLRDRLNGASRVLRRRQDRPRRDGGRYQGDPPEAGRGRMRATSHERHDSAGVVRGGASGCRAGLGRRSPGGAACIIRALMTITIMPAGKANGGRPRGWKPGQPYFDRDRCRITWHQDKASGESGRVAVEDE